MKKLILSMALLVWSMAVLAQVHTVERVESLLSIAEKYHVSVSRLVEANPGVENRFYVGLKLNIPEPLAEDQPAALQQGNVVAPVQQNHVVASEIPQTKAAVQTQTNTVADKEDKPGTEYTMNIEYGFLPKAEGVSHSSSFAYAATFGANYYFMHRLSGPFVGARIGYNSASYNSMNSAYRGHYVEVETNVHFVSVPLNIGYALATPNKNWAITPYAGMDFNFCVAGKTKIKNRAGGETDEDKKNVKKKMAVDARVGVVLRLYGFDIFTSYVMPVNKAQKGYFGDDSYLAVGIGFGF